MIEQPRGGHQVASLDLIPWKSRGVVEPEAGGVCSAVRRVSRERERERRLLLSWAKAGKDDWDVCHERGRKPKESIIKNEDARSEGDYRRNVLLARIMCDRGEGRGVRG